MGLIDDIERSTHLIAVGLEPVLAELGLGQAEAHVLAQLASRGALTANELHREFGHKRSTLTNVLDRLESRGLLERVPHPSDRRSIAVRLTAAGDEPARRVLAAREALELELAERLGRPRLEALEGLAGALAEIVR
jgi:DNA-binding MarR family transcriptional regulator